LGLLDFAWREGGVRSELQGRAFASLRVKTEQLLNPAPAAPAPTPTEKKEDKDCCGGEKEKDKTPPKGPPKVEEPKAESK
jgi:hypothetical protein